MGAGAHTELAECAADVGLDGGDRHQEGCGDLGVGEPVGDECDDLAFGRGEGVPATRGPFALASSAAGVFGGCREVEAASRFEGVMPCGRADGCGGALL